MGTEEEFLWSEVADGRAWIIFVLQRPELNLAHALVCLYNALLGNENANATYRIVKALRNRSKTCAALQLYQVLEVKPDTMAAQHNKVMLDGSLGHGSTAKIRSAAVYLSLKLEGGWGWG